MPFNRFDNYPMSWRPVLPKGNAPLYRLLAQQLEQDIASGNLLPGTKLPPQRELADFLDINLSTVARAFKLCMGKGLLHGEVGSGTFVAYGMETNVFAPPGPATIELGSLAPETIPAQEATELLSQMLAEPGVGGLFQYQHYPVARHQEAGALFLAKLGLAVPPAQVQFAGGGQNALAAILAGLFAPGDKIGTSPLVYPGLKSAAKLLGIHLVPLRERQGELCEEGLRYAIDNEGIRAIYVMPDLHNPTNHNMSPACRAMVARIAQQTGLLVLEDGINSLLRTQRPAPIAALAPGQTVYLASLSKVLLPGLRLAYLSAPPHLAAQLQTALYNLNLAQSGLLLELASRLIFSGKADTLITTRRKRAAARNRLADELLAGYPLLGPPTCLSRWLLLPGGCTGYEFEQRALAHGVAVYGAERFAVGKNPPPAAVRLAITAPETSAQLAGALHTLRGLLDQL